MCLMKVYSREWCFDSACFCEMITQVPLIRRRPSNRRSTVARSRHAPFEAITTQPCSVRIVQRHFFTRFQEDFKQGMRSTEPPCFFCGPFPSLIGLTRCGMPVVARFAVFDRVRGGSHSRRRATHDWQRRMGMRHPEILSSVSETTSTLCLRFVGNRGLFSFGGGLFSFSLPSP